MPSCKASQIAYSCGMTTDTLKKYEEYGFIKPARLYGSTGFRHYDVRNIDMILKVSSIEDAGLSLDQIRDSLSKINEASSIASPQHFSIERIERPEQKYIVFDEYNINYANRLQKYREALTACISDSVRFSANGGNFFIRAGGLLTPNEADLRKDNQHGAKVNQGAPDSLPGFQIYIAISNDSQIASDDGATKNLSQNNIALIPAQTALAINYSGHISKVNEAYKKLTDFAEGNGHTLTGMVYEQYSDKLEDADPEDYSAKIIAPVAT